MSLTVETGAGIQGAEAYATTAAISAYWTKRAHMTLATTWGAATDPQKEGAAREASAYLDATFGAYYRGQRRGRVQGLMWPRSNAKDEAGYSLPDLPSEIVTATCELAARALSAPLAADIDLGARVKSQTKKVGPIEKTTEYFDGGAEATKTSYGMVSLMLATVLNGSQPGAPNANWSWS